MAYLVYERQVPADSVVLVTFTNKAAIEMRERLARYFGITKVIAGTFHSVCLRLLRKYGAAIGLRSFSVADASAAQRMVTNLLRSLPNSGSTNVRQMQALLSKKKTELCGLAAAGPPLERSRELEQLVTTVYDAYEAQMQASNSLDFDDLLVKTLQLFRQEPSVLQHFQHTLVDEFQDTNLLQYHLAKLMGHGGLTLVGDPDQSIYSWRSAEADIFDRVLLEFPEAITVQLNQNYRSTAKILELSCAVVSGDRPRRDRPLWTSNLHGPSVPLMHLEDPQQEALQIAQEVERACRLSDGLLTFADFAVLLRTNAMSSVFEQTFSLCGVPYRLVGSTAFYDRAEIKDCLAYLRVILNLNDTTALNRIINVPKRGLGPVTCKKLFAYIDDCLKKNSAGKPVTALDAIKMLVYAMGLGDRHRLMGRESKKIASLCCCFSPTATCAA